MPKTMSLLEKAKAIPRKNNGRREYTDEDCELAIAWANGEIGMAQVSKAINFKEGSQGSIYSYLSSALRLAVQTGKLAVK